MDFNTVITHMSRVKCFVFHRPGTGSERENQRYKQGEVKVPGTLGEAASTLGLSSSVETSQPLH